MSPIPTESRIFSDRVARMVRKMEATHADRISPGCKTWLAAFEALCRRMNAAKSPVKIAATMHRAAEYLESVPPDQRAHVMIAHAGGKRAAVVVFATFSAGENPITGTTEDGINVNFHRMRCDRHGAGEGQCDEPLAYISRHALARLHQREAGMHEVDAIAAISLIAGLGCMVRPSEKHVSSELCLALDGVLVVGSLKHGVQQCRNGDASHLATVFDVRTALSIDEIGDCDVRKSLMLEQGRIALAAVKDWFARPFGEDRDLVERIPFLPARADYTMRAAKKHPIMEEARP